MIRTFLAVELPDTLRSQIALIQQDLTQRLSRDLTKDIRISWVQPSSIHLTVKFLGDTDEELIGPMQPAIEQAVRPYLPIHIPLERIGAFPRPQQPRVLWIGPSEQWARGEDAARLAALHQAVEASCASFGVAPEGRPLSPHLTLARMKSGDRQLGQIMAHCGVMDRLLTIQSLAVTSIALIQSQLRPTGSVYSRLWRVPLESS
jgi:RNA 2',3'-cyclic 3'-phosphodiesterase